LAWQLVQARGASSCGAWQPVHCACALAAITGRPAWHVVHGLTCAASKLCGAWQPVHAGWPVVLAVSLISSGGFCLAWQRAQPWSAVALSSWTLWQSMQPRAPACRVCFSAWHSVHGLGASDGDW
jgi:hypothetical protein